MNDPDLEQLLADFTEGLSPLESALIVAEILRLAYGGDWVIEFKPDKDDYVVRRPA